MYSHVAWLTDFTRRSNESLRALAALGDPDVQVVHSGGDEQARAAVREEAARLEDWGIPARGIQTQDPPQSWAEAFQWPDGLLVIGSSGKVLSSTATHILQRPGPPVLVDRGRGFLAVSDILCALDPNDDGSAVAHAVRLARAADARILFLHVLDVTQTVDPDEVMDLMRDHVAASKSPGEPVRARFEVGIAETAAQGIASVAENHSLIIMGSHARRGLARLLLGSVAEHVAASAPVPVLVMRPGA